MMKMKDPHLAIGYVVESLSGPVYQLDCLSHSMFMMLDIPILTSITFIFLSFLNGKGEWQVDVNCLVSTKVSSIFISMDKIYYLPLLGRIMPVVVDLRSV